MIYTLSCLFTQDLISYISPFLNGVCIICKTQKSSVKDLSCTCTLIKISDIEVLYTKTDTIGKNIDEPDFWPDGSEYLPNSNTGIGEGGFFGPTDQYNGNIDGQDF